MRLDKKGENFPTERSDKEEKSELLYFFEVTSDKEVKKTGIVHRTVHSC